MALSTSIPTPSATPPRLKMLKVKPNIHIKKKVNTEATGIASPMMRVRLRLPRKRTTMIMARTPPTSADERTFLIEARMKKL